jgi:hypothetical protein
MALFIKSSPGCDRHCYKLSPLQAHWGRWRYTCLLLPSLFICSSCGKCPFPTSSGAFLRTATVTSFPAPTLLGGVRHSCLLWTACLFKVPLGIALPPLQGSVHPALFAMCLFLVLFIIQFGFFSFFHGWGSVCPGGYADLAQGSLWVYCMLLSSPGSLLLSSQ